MEITKAIANFAADQLISQEEAGLALAAHAAGSDEHTIGYELEVLGTAKSDVPNIGDEINADTAPTCELQVEPYEYIVGHEGLYELKSPPAQHPTPLVVATRGLARLGWLPAEAKGLVTSHVSVGTTLELEPDSDQHDGLITLLRAVEMTGGTNANRLIAPIREASQGNFDTKWWNSRGRLGVDIPTGEKKGDDWIGKSNRVEFRTLGYYSPNQFGRTLVNLFFLSRGLLAPPGSKPYEIYADFEAWFQEYLASNGLPNGEDVILAGSVNALRNYLEPYVAHLNNATGKRQAVAARVSQAVFALSEEFGGSNLIIGEAA
jgi:hypothetical protein